MVVLGNAEDYKTENGFVIWVVRFVILGEKGRKWVTKVGKIFFVSPNFV